MKKSLSPCQVFIAMSRPVGEVAAPPNFLSAQEVMRNLYIGDTDKNTFLVEWGRVRTSDNF